jgi:hypothetical protein
VWDVLRNRCVNCDQVIEAPLSQRGKETACPHCEATNVLLAPEDVERGGNEAERDRFLAALAARRQGGPARSPGAGPTQGGEMALLAARRLKDISVYLVAFAYALLLLTLGLGLGLALLLDAPPVWRGFALGSGVLLGVVLFVALKAISDTVQALADLTDLGRSLDVRLDALQSQVTAMHADREAEERPLRGRAG